MKKEDTISKVYTVDSRYLAGLLDIKEKEDANELWRENEFPELLAQQLAAPLEFDLTTSDPKTQTKINEVHSTVKKPPGTFGELFHHPHPPIGLLKLTQKFGKKIADRRDTSLPWQVGYVIYATSIAVALVRCGEIISGLSTDELRKGLKWSIKRSWVDDQTRSLLQAGLEHLKSSSSSSCRDSI